ncbi:MAG: glycerol-3-phosphate dehydrogenase/oxidase [Microthrixaceae bacterium]|nr:glycerol-3-phosphate dehydrogenase/oxidase [Microthrixaceae bacterium]MCO5318023.1 glycerol-3-phosphate dehydrogenase/oxidase [Microthrixaceae bacterium]
MSIRPFERARSLEALATEEFDLVVVGGGITGAGVVLDAASRGMRAALVEAGDFAEGTSSKSSKLVHGGLRYLQQGEINLVYQALRERRRLLRNAPHLVEVIPFLIPMLGRGGVFPAKIARVLGAAMWGYDITGGWRIGKLHKRLDHDEAMSYMPTLPADRLVSAYLYYDATADDARLVLTVLRTAALHHGAVIANRTPVVGMTNNSSGHIDGVTVRPQGPGTDEEFTIRTRAVVNAAGVWSDDIRAQDEGVNPGSIRPAKGIHISVPWEKVRNQVAVVVPVPGDRRSVFVVPHDGLTYIGTTDTDYDGPIDDPQCTPEDVEYLLSAINASITGELTRADVTGTWAGLRPLVAAGGDGRTADLSRMHRVSRSESGLVTITGGKLTTYREMAADTVDTVVESVHSTDVGFAGWPSSRTARLQLVGAAGHDTVLAARSAFPEVPVHTAEHLAKRYGGEARALMAMIQRDPTLAETLVPGLDYVEAEVLFAARYEMANSVCDVLSRRTRARIFGRDDSLDAARRTAELMAAELGWDDDRVEEEVEQYRMLVLEERAAAGLPETHLPTTVGAVASRG